jgi:hypothetical protein
LSRRSGAKADDRGISSAPFLFRDQPIEFVAWN